MGRLVDHNIAGLVVRVPILYHVWARVNPRIPVDSQVVDEQKHQALVVQKVLKALKRELVQVIVNGDDLHLDKSVVLKQF